MSEDDGSSPLAVVTGASRRLGLTLAKALAEKGYAVGLHYNRAESEAEEARTALMASGVPVVTLQADLTDPAQISAMMNRVADSGYPLRVLVNSAAVMKRADLRTISAAEWDQTLALNLRAPMLLAQLAVRLMGSEGGLIVNVSDSGAHRAWTGYPAYIVSKAALESLTRLQARAFAPQVRVNAIAPGLYLPSPEVSDAQWSRLIERLPLGRPASGADLSKALEYLLDNEYVTGQTIVVDGGYQLV